MRSFLRKNFVIVFSTLLPVVVLGLFAAATLIPNWLVDPPAHDAVIVRGTMPAGRNEPIGVDVSVVNGRFQARVVRSDARYGGVPTVFVYSAESRSVREIEIPIPFDVSSLTHGDELIVPGLTGLRIDPSPRSPDGWEYQGPRYDRGAGLFTGLFGGGRGRFEPRLAKGSARIRIELPIEPYYYARDTRFIGWITE